MRKKRYKEIMDRLERIESELLVVHDHMNDCAKNSCGKRAPDKTASELMQEGIDSIMGYQWPPKKGGN